MVRECLFPVAGLGTRFLPVTKELAKEMVPLLDRPVIHWGVEEAANSGCDRIVLVTSRIKTALEDYFDRNAQLEDALEQKGKGGLLEPLKTLMARVSVASVRQCAPLGLGHAVLCGEPLVSGDFFAVALPDDVMISQGDPVLGQLIKAHEKTGGSVVALQKVSDEETSRYGVASGREVEPGLWKLDGLAEKPEPGTAPSNMAVMGRYVLSRSVFDVLKSTPRGAGGEIQLTDGLRTLMKNEPIYGVVYQGDRHDCGTLEGWLKATVTLARQSPRFSCLLD